MTRLIKVYGERNTNTNYLSKLIQLNLNLIEVPGIAPDIVRKLQRALPGNELVRDVYFRLSYERNLGWKHACVRPQVELDRCGLVTSDLMFLTITKNPYSWLLSLHRNPYHQYYESKPRFEDFLQREWKTVGRDSLKRDSVSSPVELWNLKNRSYLGLDPARTVFSTTEGIFVDPEAIIREISSRFHVERKQARFENYERSTKDSSKDSAYYRDYYLRERWRDELSAEAIAIINERVDRDLMAHFGYQLLT